MKSDGRIFTRDEKGRFCRKEQEEEISASVSTLIR
jgi:hypothetical protein